LPIERWSSFRIFHKIYTVDIALKMKDMVRLSCYEGDEMEEKQQGYIKSFVQYLQIEKNSSQHTVSNYVRDLQEFVHFMKQQIIHDFAAVSYVHIRKYLTVLHQKEYQRRTISRKCSSLRSFYRYLTREGYISSNPFTLVSTPKLEKRLPQYFYPEDLEELFSLSDQSTPLGQRNIAVLETLYASGIRVSELVHLDVPLQREALRREQDETAPCPRRGDQDDERHDQEQARAQRHHDDGGAVPAEAAADGGAHDVIPTSR
jgi:hypothetical protein